MKINKRAVSLIVLVITIIVMIILAGAVIISLSQTNIFEKANQAVNESDLKTVMNLASLAWSEAYFDENVVSDEDYYNYVEKELGKSGIDLDKYNLVITKQGVGLNIDATTPEQGGDSSGEFEQGQDPSDETVGDNMDPEGWEQEDP